MTTTGETEAETMNGKTAEREELELHRKAAVMVGACLDPTASEGKESTISTMCYV